MSTDTSTATTTADAATATTTADMATQTAAADTAAAQTGAQWDGKIESLPAEVQKILAEARADAGKARTTAKQQAADAARTELLGQLAPALKALGLDIPGGEQVTPEQLQKQLADEAAARQTEAQATKTIQREHQVLLSAIKAGADHEALLDSRSFLAKVADLDPTAEDFTTQVDAAVTAALTANPKLKTARVAGASSVDHAGGSGEGAVTAEQFKNMSGHERNQLARTNPALYNQLSGRS